MSEITRIVIFAGRRYAVRRPWPALPPGLDLRGVSDVAVLADGSVVALRRSDPPLVVFHADGGFARTLAPPGLIDGHFMTATADGRLFVADRDRHRILCLDADGRALMQLGDTDTPRFGAPFCHPTGIAVASDGEIYVSDGYGNTLVHRFDRDGRHLGSWGGPGRQPGQFAIPHSVAVNGRDEVVVADRDNARLQVFDRDGRFRRELAVVYKPMKVVAAADGGLVVTDQVPTVTMLDRDDQVVGRCRTIGNAPHGAAVGRDGSIFLAEMAPDALTRLQPL